MCTFFDGGELNPQDTHRISTGTDGGETCRFRKLYPSIAVWLRDGSARALARGAVGISFSVTGGASAGLLQHGLQLQLPLRMPRLPRLYHYELIFRL
jgi:hypothetical protein